MNNKFYAYLGLPLESEEIKNWLNELDIPYPKKDTRSNRSTELDIWLESKKKWYSTFIFSSNLQSQILSIACI